VPNDDDDEEEEVEEEEEEEVSQGYAVFLVYFLYIIWLNGSKPQITCE